MRVGDTYRDMQGFNWTVISTDGPTDYPIVCKLGGLSNAVRAYNLEGVSMQGVRLKLTQTKWLVLNSNGSVGIFSERPKNQNAEAIIKVEITPGQFDND